MRKQRQHCAGCESRALGDFSADPTRGAEVYDAVQAGLEDFIRARATQAAVLRSEAPRPKTYMTAEERAAHLRGLAANTE